MLMMNKRSFMVGAAGAMVGTDLLACPGRSASMTTTTSAAFLPALGEASLGLQAWMAYLHQPFELAQQGRSLTLRSLKLLDGEGALPTQQFVLGFVGDEAQAALESGVYTLRHANGHSATLYLARVGTGLRPAMRADFNLLLT